MQKGLVTVVLPIYNVEKYLDRCIKSIVCQTYKNLEIILVDDESPDQCPLMCDTWAKKDKRIKVIHKKNGGLGFARNTGIDHATGEYICFVDSDDYIALDTIEKAYLMAKKECSEIVCFGFNKVDINGITKSTYKPKLTQKVFEGTEIQNIFLPNFIAPDTSTGINTNLWMSMCGALFSMDLIKRTHWKLVSERDYISEDVYSLLCLYNNVNRVAVICEAFYFYCDNNTSLTNTYRKDRYDKIKAFYDACLKKCNEFNYSEEVKKRLIYMYFSYVIAALKMIVFSELSKTNKFNEIKDIISDSHLQNLLRKYNKSHENFKRRMLLMVLKFKMPRLCFMLVRLKSA